MECIDNKRAWGLFAAAVFIIMIVTIALTTMVSEASFPIVAGMTTCETLNLITLKYTDREGTTPPSTGMPIAIVMKDVTPIDMIAIYINRDYNAAANTVDICAPK